MISGPWCYDSRDCFAKEKTLDAKHYCCRVLTSTFYDKKCPFCKPDKEVTNGIHYPYNPTYTEHKKEETC